MLDNRQRKAVRSYRSLLARPDLNLATSVGRSEKDLGKGAAIWRDIRRKLLPQRGETLLDIGCGYGEVTIQILGAAARQGLSVTLVDIDEVIARITVEFRKKLPPDTNLVAGIFPQDMGRRLIKEERGYDCILAYSVLHYTDRPKEFISSAVRLLAPGGRLLIGDLPNVDRKGRFLVSEYGRKFEARYRGVPVSTLPLYKSAADYVREAKTQNRRINDALVLWAGERFRKSGFDVFVLSQSASLPFSHTREDLLICRR
jgi:2-polyprenyl-3-methyl-5-hydroxy-6-metoxy-1,4-benzoquinol methylase